MKLVAWKINLRGQSLWQKSVVKNGVIGNSSYFTLFSENIFQQLLEILDVEIPVILQPTGKLL